MNEEFDFNGMSDTDYTDYFADMDQDAEETAEFERIFTAAAWYCTTATELTYKPEPIRRDKLGGGRGSGRGPWPTRTHNSWTYIQRIHQT